MGSRHKRMGRAALTEIFRLVNEERRTLTEIAHHYGVTLGAVSHLLRRNNCKVNITRTTRVTITQAENNPLE